MSAPPLLDMAVLRSKLLAAQDLLLDVDPSSLQPIENVDLIAQASGEIAAIIDMVNPILDPSAEHPAVPDAPVSRALRAAHQVLVDAGLDTPVEILVVQTSDAQGRTTARTMAATIANPQDMLRLILKNLERQ